jgi:drug/metabolite transporter (DMT)-like permease
MTLQPASENKRLLALALRILGVSLLSGMMALVKLASDSGLHIAELMFWRQGLAVPVVLLWVLAGPGLASLKTARFRSHAFRGGVGLIGMICNFASAILLPLAEATTISFAVPIFATILSAVFLHERVGKHRWGAVIIGFIGMLIVVQPGGSPIPIHGALIGLGGALMVATVSLQLRNLGKTESPATIVFWFSLLSMVPLGAILPLYVSPDHSLTQWLLLGGIGVFGGIGQIAITASLRYAPVSTVVVMDYFSLLTSALLGWLIWSHLPAQSTWYGAPVIVASGLYIVWREHRLAIARAGVVTV